MELDLAEYNKMFLGEDGKPETKNKTDKAVHVNTLDNLLQQDGINEVNWIKIDVEGAELEVLKGVRNILSNSKDVSILIEIHGTSHLYKPIMDILRPHNFKIVLEKTFGDYQRQNMKGAKNVLLRKSS